MFVARVRDWVWGLGGETQVERSCKGKVVAGLEDRRVADEDYSDEHSGIPNSSVTRGGSLVISPLFLYLVIYKATCIKKLRNF